MKRARTITEKNLRSFLLQLQMRVNLKVNFSFFPQYCSIDDKKNKEIVTVHK